MKIQWPASVLPLDKVSLMLVAATSLLAYKVEQAAETPMPLLAWLCSANFGIGTRWRTAHACPSILLVSLD